MNRLACRFLLALAGLLALRTAVVHADNTVVVTVLAKHVTQSPLGKFSAATDNSGGLMIIGQPNKEVWGTFEGKRQMVPVYAFSGDDVMLAVVQGDDQITLWRLDMPKKEPLLTFVHPHAAVLCFGAAGSDW